jgi:hypothetical protein
MEFIIPGHPEDLELPQNGRYYVKEVFNVETCTDIDGVIEGKYFLLLENQLYTEILTFIV